MEKSLTGLIAGALLLAAGPSSAATLVSTWKAVTTHNSNAVFASMTLRFANDVTDAAYFTADDLIDATFAGFEGYGSNSVIGKYGEFGAERLDGAEFVVVPPNRAGVPNHVGTDGSMGEGWLIGYYKDFGEMYSPVLTAKRDAYRTPRFAVKAYWPGGTWQCTECAMYLYKSDVEYDGQATSFDGTQQGTPAVPLPATLPLLLGALAGGWGLSRRKR